MTTLPNLTPCTVPDCKAPITHWHGGDGDLYACLSALNGESCLHTDPCYAPRETAPLHLPDVDTVARKVYESDYGIPWDDEDDSIKDAYRRNAQAVLDLIAAHQPVWKRVEPGTVKPGMVLKRTDRDGGYTVFTVKHVERYGDKCLRARGTNGFYVELNDDSFTWEVDPATVPAPTLTERIRAALNDSPESTITLDVADVAALLDMAGGEDK